MPIRTLEYLKQVAPNDFLRDFIDTAYHWREQPVAVKRRPTGRIETTTEVDVAPEPLPPSATAPVYWNGVLERPRVLVDIGEQIGDAGSGALTRSAGRWSLIDYLTQGEGDVRYSARLHAPSHHWDGNDPLTGQQITELRIEDRPTWAAVRLDPTAPTPPTRRTGDMYWDADNHCPSFVLEGSDTVWQGPMEDLLYGQNDSGVAHGNGLVGYINGSQGQRPTIDISRADDRIKSLAVVFATEAEIASNNSGYYTSRGFVRDVNTNGMAQGARLWLQPTGGYGTEKPSVGANIRNVMLGHVVNSHAVTGSLFADITPYPFVDELSGVSIVSPTAGQVLAFNGTIWENATPIENHNDLSGRTVENCHNAMAITDFYALTTGQLTKRDGSGMVAAIPNTDYLAVNNPTFTGVLTGPTATLTDFGKLQALVGDSNYAAIYGTGVTPSGSNYVLRLADDGGSSALNAAVFVDIAVGGAAKATVKATELALASGVALKMAATTVIDSSRNANFTSITATTCSGIGTRPVVARPAGNLEPQDPAAFLGTIGAAPSSHTHPYLPIANPTYTGRLTGPTQYLEANEQILLAIRRPGGQSGRIHGISFMAQDSASAWVEFGRVMTYISSVTAGAHTGGMRLMAYKNGAILQALEAGPDGVRVGANLPLQMGTTTIVDSSRNATFAAITGTTCTLSGFGTLRDRVGNPAFGALYAAGVTPAATNYALAMTDAGTETYLGASDKVVLVVGGTSKLTVDADEANLASGVALKMAATTVIDSSRNITGTTLKGGNLTGTGNRPLVAGADGTIDDQDAATFRGTIAALSSANPNFTGILYQGGTQRIASDGTGWFRYLNSSELVGSTIRPLVVRADGLFVDQDAATFRSTISAAAAVHDHTSITGSAAKLTTARSIGMTGDGTWSVSFDGSANASGAMTLASIITAGGPVGSATKAPQFTWDSKGRLTAVDEVAITPAWSSITSKPTTFSGLGVTMLASDIPNHASRHHWGGADPLTGQSIAGLRTTDSPSFNDVTAVRFLSTSNGAGQNYRIGDDAWFGDINIANTTQLSGVQDPTKANLKFGTGGPTIGFDGSVFSISSGILVNGGITATNLSGTVVRPTVATAAGLIQAQDAATFRTTIDAAARLHASTHYWNGSDPLDGQSIAGLRTTSSPSFYDVTLGGNLYFGSIVGVGRNGYGGVYLRPSSGIVRLTVEDAETYCSNAFSANSGRFANLSTGFVRSNEIGELSSSGLLASELPNHASRHEYGGADSLAGQSINGLRTTDSPSFANLSLSKKLKFSGFWMGQETTTKFCITNSVLAEQICIEDGVETTIHMALCPAEDGYELGVNARRWNIRSNDLNHDLETLTAKNTTPGESILAIPSTGNGFILVNGADGSTRNYRIPNAPGSGIMKRIVLFSASIDPTGFTRIYPPSSGELWNGGTQVTTYLEFGSGSAGDLKIVMDSDGSNWYI